MKNIFSFLQEIKENRKDIDFLRERIRSIWTKQLKIEENLGKTKEELGTTNVELKSLILHLGATIDFLDIEFKDDWINDNSYFPPEPRKILRLKAVEKRGRYKS